jgi:hypothetical protein
LVTSDPGSFKEGSPWISVGMNYPVLDQVDQKLHEFYDGVDHKQLWLPQFIEFDIRKHKWALAAERELSLFQYLKKYIYN